MISASPAQHWPMWSPAAGFKPRRTLPLLALAASMIGLGRSTSWRKTKSAAPDERFAETVLPHLDAAYNLARYLTRDADAAEDIVQDAVLKAHKGLGGFRGGDAKAWLLTIVRREFIDWSNARRAGRAVFAEDAVADAAETASSDDDTPEQTLLRQGDVGAVRSAIEALPEPFRESIILRELEELSYREVAAVTGVPIGTVMSRLARGRELLARRLSPSTAEAPQREFGR
ncbi:sigma-70 family RNA polymerase sigma factor [Caulobacter sp. S45]|uniref:sigma-70 family RNA polymerase sigma factor n=1 Tax=Caulobacter sp. S45 TaxID=1641861 RepID=UPI001C20460F|nr:sigma-70 family RNA polymerase sigma factor [Caulobacter sp. S45]